MPDYIFIQAQLTDYWSVLVFCSLENDTFVKPGCFVHTMYNIIGYMGNTCLRCAKRENDVIILCVCVCFFKVICKMNEKCSLVYRGR